jgi:hypothetical protein
MLLRINLALGTAFILAALLLVYVCSRLLETNARRELVREAGLMMDSAVNPRDRATAASVRP